MTRAGSGRTILTLLMNSKSRFFTVLLVLLWLLASTAGAARLGPPSAALATEDVRVLVAEALEKRPDGRILFRKREDVTGEAPAEVLLRLGPEAFARARIGQSYLIGYTHLRDNPLFRKGKEEDPEGPRLVELAGVGDALLDDSPSMRALATSTEATPAEALDAVLDTLESSSPTNRRFAIFELFARPELTRLAGEEELQRVLAVLDGELNPLSRNFLLQAAHQFPRELGRDWLARHCRRVLDRATLRPDPLSNTPDLVRNTARLLGQTGLASDVGRLARHLRSSDTGVAKAALGAMDALDPAGTRLQASDVLESPDLPEETRRVLRTYLDR